MKHLVLRKKGLLLIPILLGLFLISSCGKSVNDGGIKVGVILPETGILATMGQYERNAMELAARELNGNTNGKKIELLFEDGKGDSKVVAAAAQKLLTIDNVDLLVTSTTGASLTSQPIAIENDTPQFAFCMTPKVAIASDSTIRFYIGIDEESRALLNRAREFPKQTRVGILYANVSLWSEVVSDYYLPNFDTYFSNPILTEEYELSNQDFKPQLTRLREGGVEVLILLGYGFEYEPIFRQLKELNMRKRLSILGGWGFLYTPLATADLEGIEVAGPNYVFDVASHSESFTLAFKDQYGYLPNFDAAFAYQLVKSVPALYDLYLKHGTKQWKSILSAYGPPDQSVVGDYTFDENGNMIVDTVVGVYRNGKITRE